MRLVRVGGREFPPSAYKPPYRSIDHYWNANVLHYKVDAQGGDQDLFVTSIPIQVILLTTNGVFRQRDSRDLAKQSGGELLRNNDDYVVPGYKSTHKDGVFLEHGR